MSQSFSSASRLLHPAPMILFGGLGRLQSMSQSFSSASRLLHPAPMILLGGLGRL